MYPAKGHVPRLDTSFVVYMSCFGTVEQTERMSATNARAIAAYLRDHPVAYPLCIVNVRVKEGRENDTPLSTWYVSLPGKVVNKVQKIDWCKWHRVDIEFPKEGSKELVEWMKHDANVRGYFAFGNYPGYWFSDADTALVFKMRFG